MTHLSDSELAKWWTQGILDHDSGRLGRPSEPGTWTTPIDAHLDGGNIRWAPRSQRIPIKFSSSLLYRLVTLVDSSDEAVLEFAQTGGVVALCEQHQLPVGHSRVINADPEGSESRCSILGGSQPYVPAEWYRDFAKRCRSMLNIAADLRGGRRGSAEDWQIVSPSFAALEDQAADGEWKLRPLSDDQIKEEEKEHLGAILDALLDVTDARMRFRWTGEGPNFGLTNSSLPAAIATSLVFAISGTGGLARCHGCNKPFSPDRQQSGGRRSYCSDPECKKASRRDAQRDHRAKKAGGAGGR